MRRICAWCKRELTPREEMGTEQEITHGICSRCALKFTDSAPRKIKSLLDNIEEPVMMVDSMGHVKSATGEPHRRSRQPIKWPVPGDQARPAT